MVDFMDELGVTDEEISEEQVEELEVERSESEETYEEAEEVEDESAEGSEDEVEEQEEVVETVIEEEPSPVVPAQEDPVIAELRQQNAQLMEMIQQGKPTPQVAPTEPEKVGPKNLDELIESVPFDELFEDKDLFRGFMAQVARLSAEQSVERVATTLPQYVIQQVEQQRVLKEASEHFYNSHETLKPHSKVVGIITNEVIQEHQDWDLDNVLSETANRCYTLLNLKQSVADGDTELSKRGTPSSLNRRARSNKGSKPKLNKLQREINDLL